MDILGRLGRRRQIRWDDHEEESKYEMEKSKGRKIESRRIL